MTVKSAAHFVDCDKTGTSGLDDWQSFNYGFPPSDPTKISISTAEELAKITWDDDFPVDGDYELANDIDCSSISQWIPLGGAHLGSHGFNNAFEGTFDGRYFTISNIQHEHQIAISYLGHGLFGTLAGTAVIKRVIITNATHTVATGAVTAIVNAGLLVGRLTSVATITDCYAQGSFTTSTNLNSRLSVVGGMVGDCVLVATITRCGVDVAFVTPNAFRNQFVGGFVGRTAGAGSKIYTDCYAIGTWTAAATSEIHVTGGFTGHTDYFSNHENHFNNCYSALAITGEEFADPPLIGGFIGRFDQNGSTDVDFSACFWDNDVIGSIKDRTGDLFDCGQLASTGDEGNITEITKSTTVNMQMQSTFTDVGWDFDDVWQITTGDYPRHIWKTSVPFKIQTGRQERTTAMPTDHAHLNGQTVQGLGDGSFLGTEVVAGGDVTMDDATTVNHVGLQYTSTILPMKIDGEVNVKRISKIIPNVNETVGGDYGRSIAKLTSMVLRDSDDPLDTDAALFSGHTDLPFDGTYNRSADIYIRQTFPLPFNLLGIGVEYSQEAI